METKIVRIEVGNRTNLLAGSFICVASVAPGCHPFYFAEGAARSIRVTLPDVGTYTETIGACLATIIHEIFA
jgi:hypothetical protein